MIHRKLFYDSIRQELFGRVLKDSQVEGIDAILNSWEVDYPDKDLRWLAYALGTAHHETDRTMQPIEEYEHGGDRWYAKPDPETGLCYYGRGLVQLTHKKNYRKAGLEICIDLVHQPELACNINYASEILLDGMVEGWFTGARLDWYFNKDREDWINARRIVNSLDRAELVAGYAKLYFEALSD